MWCTCAHGSVPSDQQNSMAAKIKIYAFNGLCVIITCALLYRNLPTSESSTQEVVFHTVPLYVQILITLFTSTIQKVSLCSYASGIHQDKNVKLLHWIYLILTIVSLIVGNSFRLSVQSRIIPENIFQIVLCFIPLLSEVHYCRVCAEFRNHHRDLRRLVADGHFMTAKSSETRETGTDGRTDGRAMTDSGRAALQAIRAERKTLNGRAAKTTGGGAFGAQILSEIAITAITAVFRIHRALRAAERSENTVTSESAADLLDVLHRVLRLFALCKVSGDVTKEANEIVANLLNINPNADKDLENEISFFLWEIENPPTEMRLVYGTFVLGPELFVSVFSWCVGFILILLQFRWPRTY